jgi:hypothetical protein
MSGDAPNRTSTARRIARRVITDRRSSRPVEDTTISARSAGIASRVDAVGRHIGS